VTVRPTKVPGFGKLPASMDPQTRSVLEGLIEAVEIRLGRKGDPQDRAITLRELIESGLALQLKASPFDPNRYGAYNLGVGPLTTANMPYAPTGFTANGAYSQVNLFWDGAFYQGHSQTEIYSHTSDSIGDATLAGVSTGISFVDPVGSGVTRYYWIRHVNVNGIKGPFNAAAGTLAQTATDVAHQLAVLSTAITSSQLASALSTPIGQIPGINSKIENIEGQYSVKIDNNGHVAGFGLSNTGTTATPSSAFIVRADKFAIIDPASSADGLGSTSPTAANIPFTVDSGVVFMASAMIKDATITSAKIGSVNADTINAGTLSANRIAAGAIGVNKLNLVGTGATINLASANSGARMIIQGSNITVFDASGTLRVKLGNLS